MKLRTINFNNYDELVLVLETLNSVGIQAHTVYEDSCEDMKGYVVCDKEATFGKYAEVERIENEEPECVWFYRDGYEKEYYRILEIC